MKRLIVLCVAVLFLLIGGCFKKTTDSQKSGDTNDLVTQLIQEDVLAVSTNNGDALSNGGLMENIPGSSTNQVSDSLPAVPEGIKPTNAVKPSAPVVAEPEMPRVRPQDKPVEAPVEAVATTTSRRNSYIKVGDDSSAQSASPRKSIRLTLAVMPKMKAARYVDFVVYAVPKGSGKMTSRYIISMVRNVEVINGQSQLTKIWNGKNVEGTFLDAGKYNIYLSYKVKDSRHNVIKTEGRYWGSESYYIQLY